MDFSKKGPFVKIDEFLNKFQSIEIVEGNKIDFLKAITKMA